MTKQLLIVVFLLATGLKVIAQSDDVIILFDDYETIGSQPSQNELKDPESILLALNRASPLTGVLEEYPDYRITAQTLEDAEERFKNYCVEHQHACNDKHIDAVSQYAGSNYHSKSIELWSTHFDGDYVFATGKDRGACSHKLRTSQVVYFLKNYEPEFQGSNGAEGEKDILTFYHHVSPSPEKKFVDIGGNVGEYTREIYEIFGHQRARDIYSYTKMFNMSYKINIPNKKEPTVFLFEPGSESIETLMVLMHNFPPSLHVYQAAISNKNGEMAIYSGIDREEYASVHATLAPTGKLLNVAPVHTFDSFFQQSASNISRFDMVKIDVEGFDNEVLDGMKETISHGAVDMIQFEYGSKWMKYYRKDQSKSLKTRVEWFDNYGYDVYFIGKSKLLLLTQGCYSRFLESTTFYRYAHHNLLAIKRGTQLKRIVDAFNV